MTAADDRHVQPILYWYNYQTGEYEAVTDATANEINARKYIPQHPAAQGLFSCHRQLGESIPEAMIAVLSAVLKAQESEARS